MTTTKKEKKLCWFGVYVLSDRALLPTCIETDQGDFDVEPIRQIDYRNPQDLADAIANAILVGNPPGEAPPRENQKERTPMEKLANAKSWIDLERKSIYISIKVYPSEVLIESPEKAGDGSWSDEKDALSVRVPKEAGAVGIADVILKHLGQRTDLAGLAV
jgi:hypothetical protein